MKIFTKISSLLIAITLFVSGCGQTNTPPTTESVDIQPTIFWMPPTPEVTITASVTATMVPHNFDSALEVEPNVFLVYLKDEGKKIPAYTDEATPQKIYLDFYELDELVAGIFSPLNGKWTFLVDASRADYFDNQLYYFTTVNMPNSGQQIGHYWMPAKEFSQLQLLKVKCGENASICTDDNVLDIAKSVWIINGRMGSIYYYENPDEGFDYRYTVAGLATGNHNQILDEESNKKIEVYEILIYDGIENEVVSTWVRGDNQVFSPLTLATAHGGLFYDEKNKIMYFDCLKIRAYELEDQSPVCEIEQQIDPDYEIFTAFHRTLATPNGYWIANTTLDLQPIITSQYIESLLSNIKPPV